MTTDALLALLSDRGLAVVALEGGQLALHGPRTEATPSLLAVLAFHKAELSRRLGVGEQAEPEAEECAPGAQAEPAECDLWRAEYLWRFGHRFEQSLLLPAPVGAWWWRFAGSAGEWMPVAGRPVEGDPPEGC